MGEADLEEDVCLDAGRHALLPVRAVRRDDRRLAHGPPVDCIKILDVLSTTLSS